MTLPTKLNKETCGVLLGLLLDLRAHCTLTTLHRSHGIDTDIYSSLLLDSLGVFPLFVFVNSYPRVYVKHCQTKFVTLRPDVVTSHREARTRINERSVQRNIDWNIWKVSILLQWLFILYPTWLHRMVNIRMLCRYLLGL